MATHSNTLAWKIPWTEEPGRLQSVGSQRVRHHWATSLSFFLSIENILSYNSDHFLFCTFMKKNREKLSNLERNCLVNFNWHLFPRSIWQSQSLTSYFPFYVPWQVPWLFQFFHDFFLTSDPSKRNVVIYMILPLTHPLYFPLQWGYNSRKLRNSDLFKISLLSLKLASAPNLVLQR